MNKYWAELHVGGGVIVLSNDNFKDLLKKSDTYDYTKGTFRSGGEWTKRDLILFFGKDLHDGKSKKWDELVRYRMAP